MSSGTIIVFSGAIVVGVALALVGQHTEGFTYTKHRHTDANEYKTRQNAARNMNTGSRTAAMFTQLRTKEASKEHVYTLAHASTVVFVAY